MIDSILLGRQRVRAYDFWARVHWREEFRRALFVAADSIWIYLLFYLLTGITRLVQPISMFSVFSMYYAGTIAGRVTPLSRRRWITLQTAIVSIGAALLLIIIRVEFFRSRDNLDLGWLADYAARLILVRDGLVAEHLATLALILTYGRGLRLATRPLTLWFLGYQFRLTLVYTFFILVLASWSRDTLFNAILPYYFAVWILTIILARVEESGQAGKQKWRWYATFLIATGIVIVTGLILALLFQNGGIALLERLISPVVTFAVTAIAVLLLPFVLLASFVANALAPILSALIMRFQGFIAPFAAGPQPDWITETFKKIQSFESLLPLGRSILLIAGLGILGLWVARQLNRRMTRYEEAHFVVKDASSIREHSTKPRESKRRTVVTREIHAENIRRIYAAFQQRAAKAGLARLDAETPLEFLARAGSKWAEAADDLRSITHSYISVHYAEKPATAEEEKHARDAWNHARSLIIDLRKKRVTE